MATKPHSEQTLSGNNLIIVLVLVSLIIIGISGFAVKTLFQTIRRDTKVVSAKSKADNQLQQNIEAAPGLVSSYQNLGPQATLLANALPNTADFPSLIVALENMAGAAGVRLKTVAPGLGTGVVSEAPKTTQDAFTPTPQVYPFSVTFDGTYPNLQKLLANLETSARPIRVVGMQVSGTGNALSGQIDMQTYFQDKATLPFGTETIK